MDWRRKYDYGVGGSEVEAFVAENPCVSQFLGKYAASSRHSFSRYLCMFFKWLRMRKGLELSPSEFLQQLSEERASKLVEDKCWGRNLLRVHSG